MTKNIKKRQIKKEIELIKRQNNPFLNALLETTNFQKIVNLYKKYA